MLSDILYIEWEHRKHSNTVKPTLSPTKIVEYSRKTRIPLLCRAQWFRGRASDYRLREPGFESCAAVLKPWASFFTLHCSSSLSCIHEYLAIDTGGYVYEQPSRINYSIWLDRCFPEKPNLNCVWANRSAWSIREVKCKALWTVLMTGYCAI